MPLFGSRSFIYGTGQCSPYLSAGTAPKGQSLSVVQGGKTREHWYLTLSSNSYQNRISQTAFYCSREHQMTDWREGHREYCNNVQVLRKGKHSWIRRQKRATVVVEFLEGYFTILHKLDEGFIRGSVKNYVWENLENLEELRKRSKTDTMAVECNYRVFPPKFGFGAVSSCPVDDQDQFERSKPLWEHAVQCGRAHSGNIVIFRAYLPQGGQVLFGVICIPT